MIQESGKLKASLSFPHHSIPNKHGLISVFFTLGIDMRYLFIPAGRQYVSFICIHIDQKLYKNHFSILKRT